MKMGKDEKKQFHNHTVTSYTDLRKGPTPHPIRRGVRKANLTFGNVKLTFKYMEELFDPSYSVHHQFGHHT